MNKTYIQKEARFKYSVLYESRTMGSLNAFPAFKCPNPVKIGRTHAIFQPKPGEIKRLFLWYDSIDMDTVFGSPERLENNSVDVHVDSITNVFHF